FLILYVNISNYMDNIIFILSHYDDEFGLFNVIESSTKNNKKVFVFYLTNGLTKKDIKNKTKLYQREKESTKILTKLGVKKNNIIFLGKKLNIPVYYLYKNLGIVYNEIYKFLNKLDGKCLIYTHSWEGGNEDHDSSYVIVKKILSKNQKSKKGFQFSQYHKQNTILYPFKVQTLISSKGKIFRNRLGTTSKIKYIYYLFTYISQFYLWLPVYPFIIYKILINDYGNVKIISKNLKLSRPHSGNLLYEKLRKNKFKELKIFFFNFLKNAK
ncbi:PIG-L family deacetylase, partial [Candidatus Pelagibacter sp.]|nr:PIG-L family deacetylase [Candidatus Pelagibacter sp.]